MKKKNKLLLLSGLVMANTLLGSSGNEDAFATEEVFDTAESQQVVEVATTTEEGLKIQVIPNEEAFDENNGFKIKKGMDQYVLDFGVRCSDNLEEKYLKKLRPLYTDKAKKLGKKPIVFKYQNFFSYDPLELIEETDEFSVENFYISYCSNVREFGKFCNTLNKYGKPIIFKNVDLDYKDRIENKYDLSNCKITYYSDAESFDEYLELTSNIENLRIDDVEIQLESISEEELKKQLYVYTRDKRVEEIDFVYNEDDRKGMISVPIEYASCIKVDWLPLINPKNTEDILFFPTQRLTYIENISCDTLFNRDFRYNDIGKNVFCKNFVLNDDDDFDIEEIYKINNLETIWIALDQDELDEIREGAHLDEDNEDLKQLVDRNISVRFFNKDIVDDLISKYKKHIKNKDIAYLSGYVNVKNKPNDLSDEEWKQVLILKQKVKEIINAVQTNMVEIDCCNP